MISDDGLNRRFNAEIGFIAGNGYCAGIGYGCKQEGEYRCLAGSDGMKPLVDSGMSPRSDALQSMTVWRLCGLANCGVVGCLMQDGYSWIGIELGNRLRIQSLKVGDCIGSADGRQNRSVGILRISVALRE